MSFRHRLSPSGPFLNSGLLGFGFATGPDVITEVSTDDSTPIVSLVMPQIGAGERLLVFGQVNAQQNAGDNFIELSVLVEGISVAPLVSPEALANFQNAFNAGRNSADVMWPFIATVGGSATVTLQAGAGFAGLGVQAEECALSVLHIQAE